MLDGSAFTYVLVWHGNSPNARENESAILQRRFRRMPTRHAISLLLDGGSEKKKLQ